MGASVSPVLQRGYSHTFQGSAFYTPSFLPHSTPWFDLLRFWRKMANISRSIDASRWYWTLVRICPAHSSVNKWDTPLSNSCQQLHSTGRCCTTPRGGEEGPGALWTGCVYIYLLLVYFSFSQGFSRPQASNTSNVLAVPPCEQKRLIFTPSGEGRMISQRGKDRRTYRTVHEVRVSIVTCPRYLRSLSQSSSTDMPSSQRPSQYLFSDTFLGRLTIAGSRVA